MKFNSKPIKKQLSNHSVTKICRHKQSASEIVHTQSIYKLSQKQISQKYQQLHKQGQKLWQKRKQMQQKYFTEKQKEQLKQCTFRPKINQNMDYYIPPTPFLKRQKQWIQQKNKKLQVKKEQMKVQEIQQCTFFPKNQSLKKSSTSYTNLIKPKNYESITTKAPLKKSNSYVKIFKQTLQKKQLQKLCLKNVDKIDGQQMILVSTRRDDKQSSCKRDQFTKIRQQLSQSEEFI